MLFELIYVLISESILQGLLTTYLLWEVFNILKIKQNKKVLIVFFAVMSTAFGYTLSASMSTNPELAGLYNVFDIIRDVAVIVGLIRIILLFHRDGYKKVEDGLKARNIAHILIAAYLANKLFVMFLGDTVGVLIEMNIIAFTLLELINIPDLRTKDKIFNLVALLCSIFIIYQVI